MKQFEVLNWASSFLKNHNSEPMIAEILLQHHLALDRSQFYASMHNEVSREIFKQFETDIKLHVESGIPVQHLIGYEIFYGRKFTVNEHVLIPRPETEELVYYVIEQAMEKFEHEKLTIIDAGTGSGVIAITLALQFPSAQIFATDISEKALSVAKQNAVEHGVTNITFLKGDFLNPIISRGKKANIIVSNPPYISTNEKSDLSRTVLEFDPELALFAEDNGLAAYRKITEQAKQVVDEEAILAFEIGYKQAYQVQDIILQHFPNSRTDIIQDINGNDRIVAGYL